MSEIKSIHNGSSACVRIKCGEIEWLRTDSRVRQRCIMTPWLFTVYLDAVMKEVKIGMGKRETPDLEEMPQLWVVTAKEALEEWNSGCG